MGAYVNRAADGKKQKITKNRVKRILNGPEGLWVLFDNREQREMTSKSRQTSLLGRTRPVTAKPQRTP